VSIPSRPERIARLTDDMGFSSPKAELMADSLEGLHPDLHEGFMLWWNTGELPAMEVEGYTAEFLVKEHGFTPLAALLTLSSLRRDPGPAKATLTRYDEVITE
jgi:hypothetical protein